MQKHASLTIPTQDTHGMEAEPNAKAQTVLRAGRTVFLMHGFNAATTDMIQREAKVSKSTVYAHYPNKEALFIAVVEAECAEFARSVRGLTFSPGQLRETLTALGRAYLKIVLSPPVLSLFRVVVAEAPRFPALARTFYLAAPGVVVGIVAQRLAEAGAAGEIDLGVLGCDATASQFASLVRSEPHLQCLLHPEAIPSEAQFDQWVAAAVTTFMRAYGRV